MKLHSKSDAPKSTAPGDIWADGLAYEAYMGRWSRLVASRFLPWLGVDQPGLWLDVGCGIGVLSQTILQTASAVRVVGLDSSGRFIFHAREQIKELRADFVVGNAQELPFASESFDAIASGLMLNFLSHPEKAITEMRRVAKPHGIVAAYMWDYTGEMQLLRHFWDAAVVLDQKALELDEGRRFPLWTPEPLQALFQNAGLAEVTLIAIDIPTDFKDFDDYWSPFLGGQGPAPSYTLSLTEEKRLKLREQIRSMLPFAPDGSIPLMARAWAVRGFRV